MKCFGSLKRLLPLFFSLALVACLPVAVHAVDEAAGAVAVEQVERVDINTASAEEIARVLVGVGPAKARAIVQYREANGNFSEVEQLLEVRGIGAATMEKNRERISL